MSCTNSHPILQTFSSEYPTLEIYESSFGNRGNISQSIFIASSYFQSLSINYDKEEIKSVLFILLQCQGALGASRWIIAIHR